MEIAGTERGKAPKDDIPGAITNLIDLYQNWNAVMLRLREWNARVFAKLLRSRRAASRRLAHAQLTCITDLMTWRLLTHDFGLPRPAVERAMVDLIYRLEGDR